MVTAAVAAPDGRAARSGTPRSSHGDWAPAGDRPDPIELLEEQAATREPSLVPIRHGRMAVSPFTFYRGAAYILASDLAGSPDSGITVQLCGDAHLSNFGGFASPDRNLVFDLNDFDETLPGPWEWDVKRLAATAVERMEKVDVVVNNAGMNHPQPIDAITDDVIPANLQLAEAELALSGKMGRELTLKRAKVDIPAVDAKMIERNGKKIAYVQLFGFTGGAHGELREKLEKLIDQGADGVILDLRGNGGGLLNEGVLVASTFIEDGLIVSTKGRSRPEAKYDAKGDAIGYVRLSQ